MTYVVTGQVHTPKDPEGSLPWGLLLTLGPGATVIAAAALTHFSPVPTLIAFFAVSWVTMPASLWSENRLPCLGLERPSASERTRGLTLVFATAIGLGTTVVVAG